MELIRNNVMSFIAQSRGLTSVATAPSIPRANFLSVDDTSSPHDNLPTDDVLFTVPHGPVPSAWRGGMGAALPVAPLGSHFSPLAKVDVAFPKVVVPSGLSPCDFVADLVGQMGSVLQSDVFRRYGTRGDVPISDAIALLPLALLDEIVKRGTDDQCVNRLLAALRDVGGDGIRRAIQDALSAKLNGDGGFSAVLLIGLVLLSSAEASFLSVAESAVWWDLLMDCLRSTDDSSAVSSFEACGSTHITLKTQKRAGSQSDLCLSRLALYPLPGVRSVSAVCEAGTSLIKIISFSGAEAATASVSGSKTGWAKHAVRRVEKSFITTVSGHGHTSAKDVTVSPEHHRNGLFLSGELNGKLSLTSGVTLSGYTSWFPILRAFASCAVVVSLRHIFITHVRDASVDPSVALLLSTGTSAQNSTVLDESTLGPTLALCRATGPDNHWQGIVTKLIAVVTHLSGDFKGACNVVRQRWLLHWRPVLQGDGNFETRARLEGVCSYILTQMDTGSLCPIAVLAALFKLLERGVTAEMLSCASERATSLSELVARGLGCLPKMVPALQVISVFPLMEGGDVMACFAGAPCADVVRFSEIIFSSIRDGLLAPASSLMLEPQLLKLDESAQKRLSSLLPASFWIDLVRRAAVEPTGVAFNQLQSTQAGVRVTAAPLGGTMVECSRMGDICLRASHGWRTQAGTSAVQYMEVQLLSEGYRRVFIGLGAPTRQCDSVATASSAPHVMAFNDDNQQFYVSKGDVIGCGLFNESVQFTFNGTIFHTEELRKTKAGYLEVAEYLPFVFFSTTSTTSARINFGEAPFLFDIPSAAVVSVDLITGALTNNSPFFVSAFDACLSFSDGPIPLPIRLALRQNIDLIGDVEDRAVALAEKISREGDFGGELMADLIKAFDFLPIDFRQLAANVIAAAEGLHFENDVEVREHTMCWGVLNSDGVQVSGNEVVLSGEDTSFGASFGSLLPYSDSVSFSVTLRRQPESSDEVGFIGSVYVGVSAVNSLDPIGWKTACPRQAWALHRKVGEQLSYANLPPLPSGIPLFNDDSTLLITVNRSKGTIEFNCDGNDLGVVFSDIPQDIPLRPFVQLVGEKSRAFSGACRFVSPSLCSQIARSQYIALLRALLVVDSSADSVANWISREVHAQRYAWVLSVLGSSPDPRYCSYQHQGGSVVATLLYRSSATAFRVLLPNGAEADLPICLLYPLESFVGSRLPDIPMHGVSRGLESSIGSVASAIQRWSDCVLCCASLEGAESMERAQMETEALHSLRSLPVPPPENLEQLWSRNGGLLEAMLSPVPPPRSNTFSVQESHTLLSFPSHYGGSLMLAPMSSPDGMNSVGPYVGLGSESIPREGQVNIRMVIDRDWLGMLPYRFANLSDAYSVGVCTATFKGEARIHSRKGSPKNVWAIPALGTKAATLPNSILPALNTRYFNTADKLRICINRLKGTMELFVTPLHGAEQSIGVAFADLPSDTDLFPFVQLGDLRASALLLPDQAALPRNVENMASNLKHLSKGINGHVCDGCLRSMSENAVAPPNWYRCNQCACYDLCHECFASHVHPGHTFTQMRLISAAPSPLRLVVQPSTIRQQQVAEIMAAPVRLARVIGGPAVLSQLSIENGSKGDWVGGVWATLRRSQGKASTEIRFRFTTRGSRSPIRAVFGVGSWDSISVLSDGADFAKLPTREVEDGHFPTVVAADTQSLRLTNSNCRSMGFSATTDDVFAVSFTGTQICLNVRGVLVRTAEVSLGSTSMVAFLTFKSNAGVVAELFHPTGDLVTGRICEHSTGGLVRLASAANSRWCDVTELREPLAIIETAAALVVGLHVYIVDDTEGFKECVVTCIATLNDNTITLDDGVCVFSYTANRVWVPSSVNTIFKEEANSPYREEKLRMRRFYARYAPEKSDEEMDVAIQKFSASSIGIDGMFAMLVKKYGPEPAVEIRRPVPKAPLIPQNVMGTQGLRDLARLLLVLSSNKVGPFSEAFKQSLLRITAVAPPSGVTRSLLMHGTAKPFALLDTASSQSQSTSPVVRSPVHVSLKDSDNLLRFYLTASTSHSSIVVTLSLNGDEGSGLLEMPSLGELRVRRSQGATGAIYSITSTASEVPHLLRDYLGSQARANAFYSPTTAASSLIEVEVVGTDGNEWSVCWWSVGGHHGYGTLTGVEMDGVSSGIVISSTPPCTVEGPAGPLHGISRAALNVRAQLVAPGDPSVSFIDIATQPGLSDRFCLAATDGQMSALFTEALTHAEGGRFIPYLPVVAKHQWLRSRDTDGVLRPMMRVVMQNWRNVNLLRSLTTFGEDRFGSPEDLASLRAIVATLLAPLCHFYDALARNHVGDHRLHGAAIDAFYALGMTANYLPLEEIALVSRIGASVEAGAPLPCVIDGAQREWQNASPDNVWTTSLLSGIIFTELSIDQINGSGGAYFEVVQPKGRVILCVSSHDASKSIAFDGINIKRDGGRWRGFGYIEAGEGDVIGCWVTRGAVNFSVNSHRFTPVPITFEPRHAYITVDYSESPLVIYSSEGTTQYTPDGARALYSQPCRLADQLEACCESTVTERLRTFVAKALGVILPFVDRSAEGSIVRRSLIQLKGIVSEEFRNNVLAPLKPLGKGERSSIPTVSVKWYQLFSSASRTPAEALRATVLAQLHSQLTRDEFYEVSPMFVTSLSMTESSHTPVDAGGPYMAVWGLIAEEIMTTESEKPNFHRNPMFVLTDGKDRKVMIPNRLCVDFPHLYHFLGVLLGHMARAKTPVALDLSPYVWKVMVGDAVSVEEFFSDVDGYLQPLLDDDELLMDDGRIHEAFPEIDRYLLGTEIDLDGRRSAARQCILHLLDAQLLPMKAGLATVLGGDSLPFMSWRDLERSVCGDPNPTFEQVQGSISCALPEPQQALFWSALQEMNPAEWGQFFSFCSAQRRYPLSRKIIVIPDSHASMQHLPVAQTCFSQLRVPLYGTKDQFLIQLRKCISSQEMELA